MTFYLLILKALTKMANLLKRADGGQEGLLPPERPMMLGEGH